MYNYNSEWLFSFFFGFCGQQLVNIGRTLSSPYVFLGAQPQTEGSVPFSDGKRNLAHGKKTVVAG